MCKAKIFKHVLFECMFMNFSYIWTKKSSKKLRLMAGGTEGVSLTTKKRTFTDAGMLSVLIFSIQKFQQIDTNRTDIKLKGKKKVELKESMQFPPNQTVMNKVIKLFAETGEKMLPKIPWSQDTIYLAYQEED